MCDLGRKKWAVGAGKPFHEIIERSIDRVGIGGGQAHNDRGAKCIADAGRVFCGANAIFASDVGDEGTPFGDKLLDQ